MQHCRSLFGLRFHGSWGPNHLTGVSGTYAINKLLGIPTRNTGIRPGTLTLHQSGTQGFRRTLLGGSCAVISGVISRVTIVITHIRGLITPLKNYR